jgi:hypothetical protein
MGFGSRRRKEVFLFSRAFSPPSLLSNGYWGYSGQGMKLTTHLDLMQRSRMLELPPYVIMAWFLIKHRNNFTFTSVGLVTWLVSVMIS